MTDSKFSDWAASKFEGLSREQLREAGAVFGCTFAPNTSERTMRAKLCEQVGMLPNEAQEPAPAAVTPKVLNARFDPKPNLTASGTWGGRRHYVSIFPQDNQSENSPKYVRLFHECIPRDYPYGEKINLPEPLYESLRQAQRGNLNPREIRTESGELVRIEHIEQRLPRYPFQDLGIVPGTENLPGSLREYWQRQAAKTDNFEGLPRRQLIAIRADLLGPVGGRDFYKDLTDQDILYDVLTFLGVDELAEAA
jgi:hypothetical protein